MEVIGKAALVKGKVEGNGRKGQSRGGKCLGRGCGVGAPMEGSGNRGVATAIADPIIWGGRARRAFGAQQKLCTVKCN